ncbi:MAG: LamG domain-containing protein [Phycisphaerales bacterium]|nr:LamG domain-containing protein [Phycisphaerales bacterium]
MKATHALSGFALAALAASNSIAGLETGLVAHYTFDNGAVIDNSPNQFDLAAASGSLPAIVASPIGGPSDAALFGGGSSSVLTAGQQSAFDNLNDTFSIAFWIRPTADGIVIDKDQIGTTTSDWNIRVRNGGFLAFEFGTNGLENTTMSLDDGAWHHVAYVRNRALGILDIYVDGALDRSATGRFNDFSGNTDALNIGGWELGSMGNFADGFAGGLDDLRFYDRLLTSEDVAALAVPAPAGLGLFAAYGFGAIRRRRRPA